MKPIVELGYAVRISPPSYSTSEAHISSVSGPCQKETTETGGPSLDGTCGPNFPKNRTCTGAAATKFGACCSNYGFCGNEAAHCESLEDTLCFRV
jgi:chitin recognition protein